MKISESGQGIVDYGLLLVLLTIVLLAVLQLLGPVIASVYADSWCQMGITEFCNWTP